MNDKLIAELNSKIAEIDGNEIRKHIDQGNLDEWLWDWRVEIASVSFGLYSELYENSKNLTFDELKEIILGIECKEAETQFVKGLIVGSIIKKMEEKKNEILS